MIIPSIDLIEGKAVQLQQGNKKILEVSDPVSLAYEFRKYGDIAVIDLDAALGKGSNLDLIAEICKIADCRVGGGIRDADYADRILGMGAKKIIIGTRAEPEFLNSFSRSRIIAAIDSRNGRVATNGWTKQTSSQTIDKLHELEDYCSEFLYTDIVKEGMLKGIDLPHIRSLRALTSNEFTYAGGISTISDIISLHKLNINSQIGMSLYTGKIRLSEAFTSLIDFEKGDGLVPTIVKDLDKQVLMLAYSNKESITQALESGQGTYYSRSRQSIWKKGESSGNTQELLKARFDCDADALIYTVKQKNVACHKGTYSCFGDKEFSLSSLYDVILRRIDSPIPNSYTSRLIQDEDVLLSKIQEEAEEVCSYTDRRNLIWEIADLTYFVMVLMASKGISIQDVLNELWRRRK